MQFFNLSDARYYLKTHTSDFQKKLRIVKFTHCCLNELTNEWDYKPAWTVVMQ